MATDSLSEHPARAVKGSWLTRSLPVLTLLLLSPIIVDVLPGTTRLSTLVGLISEIVTYGCAALLIRWLVRSRGLSNGALILFGIAYALMEECVFLQTSLTPSFGAPAGLAYGRVWGVSWLYLLWAVGYESVWAVLMPVQLVDLLFPKWKRERWFGRRGFLITCALFVCGAIYAWYFWSHVVAVQIFQAPAYQTPIVAMLLALLVSALLVFIALRLKSSSHPRQVVKRSIPFPWLMGLLAFLFALLWYVPLFLDYGLVPHLPFLIPLIGGCLYALLVFSLLRFWSASAQWRDRHVIACICGALVASMLEGFVTLFTASPIDVVGKLVLDVLALVGLYLLARHLRRSAALH